MVRPRRMRFVRGLPEVDYFKPRAVPMTELDEVILHIEEFEAVKLSDVEALEQEEASKKMKVSRQTFGRVLSSARKKIADAIVFGKALRVEGGVNNWVGVGMGFGRQGGRRHRHGWR